MEWIIIYLAVLAIILAFNHAAVKKRKFEESLDNMRTFFDENPDFLLDDGDEELGWYEMCDESACAFCEDILFENDVFVGFPDDEDGYILSCEYCLNPALKD